MNCLEPECRETPDAPQKTDVCAICSDELHKQPALELDCGHLFHADCLRELLRHRWSTQRISFNFMRCPSCQQEITGGDTVPEVRQELGAMRVLKKNLSR